MLPYLDTHFEEECKNSFLISAYRYKEYIYKCISRFLSLEKLWFYIWARIFAHTKKKKKKKTTNVSYTKGNTCVDSLIMWAPSSEFVSSIIPSWQILTAHAQPFRGARDLAFCLNVLDSLLVWASSEGSGETARMRRLAWTFAACIGDKY